MNAPVQPITTEAPPRLPALIAGGHVRAIVPNDFDSAWRIANAVVKAGMAPSGLQSPEKAMVAIMHGLEVGLTPMAALQSIAVINGKPTIYGDGALGLVRGSGLLEWIEEVEERRNGDGMTAICRVKRKGEPKPIERTFSEGDAKQAGLSGKEGPWRGYPKRMRLMRARAFALRDGFADVLKGLAIREEVEDYQPMRDVTPRDDGPPQPPAANLPEPMPQTEAVQPATDDLDIPESLRRNGDNTLATAADVFDGAQWLRDLDGAYSGCEDAASLFEVDQKVFTPTLAKAMPPDRKKAAAIREEHFTRVTQVE